ncbi:MAG: hypothetical protein GKS07_07780 [Nitrosopumilus sp.]|nr:MAG: hypothetical protein GKS07_07780 [Nitrosopumilus sp.]
MKIKTAYGIAMIAALFMSVATIPTDNAFAEKAVVDEISSSFKRADFIHNAEGTAKVITHDDWSQVLQFGSNFKSTSGPDVYVYLASDERASDFVNLGMIQSNEGAQEYSIPAGTDLNEYDKILIWCQAFGVLFGSADLPEYTASPATTSENNYAMKEKMQQKEESMMMMEKEAIMQQKETHSQNISEDRIFIKGKLTAPADDKPFGGNIVGDYNVRVRDGEQLRVFATFENTKPDSTVLEGWLVDMDSDYKLSLGKTNAQGKLIFTERMVNPWIYDVLVITEEPIGDFDPTPNKPAGGILLEGPFGQ